MFVFLLFAAVLTQVPTQPTTNAPPDQKCILAGRVVNSQTGEPLKKATVHLRSVGSRATNSESGYTATSDAEGNFRIEGIEPGNYTLSGERTGFLLTQYGAKQPRRMGRQLTLSPGQQMTDINLGLFPQAVISGKVVDEDGDPIADAIVQVLRQTWVRGKLQYLPQNSAQTNDLGEYRLASLGPGKYLLCADKTRFRPAQETTQPGKPDIRPTRTCYPGAANITNATPIEIAMGQDLPGTNIQMRSAQTFHVRGKIAGNLPSGDSGRISVNLIENGDRPFFFGGRMSMVGKDQTFDIGGVAPGSYVVNLFMIDGRVRSIGHQSVEVGQADVNDVIVPLVQPGSLHGTVHLEGTPTTTSNVNLASVHVNLIQAGSGLILTAPSEAQVKPDGTFSLEDVSPVTYDVHVRVPNGAYVKSARFGQQEILGKELDLSQGASGNLEITLRYGPAEVDGTVQVQNSSSLPGVPAAANVVLVPEVLNDDGSGLEFGTTNQNGNFTIRQVPPGRYRTYAFEQIDTSQLENPELLKQLENLGTEVEVKENDRKQIQLTLISADDVQELFTRLGIDSEQ